MVCVKGRAFRVTNMKRFNIVEFCRLVKKDRLLASYESQVRVNPLNVDSTWSHFEVLYEMRHEIQPL